MAVSDGRTAVIVAVCTYQRNEPLRNLLNAIIVCADAVRDRAAVGVVIVDDTAHEGARSTVEDFAGRFELGVQYRVSGKANISLARNLAMETAMPLGDWIAMTDDDCEPVPNWIEALLDVQGRTGADAVTGIMVGRAPAGSPGWIVDQPFLEFGAVQAADGEAMEAGYTNNSLLSSAWLTRNPQIRFDPNLGVIGGEDIVFFKSAKAAGLKIHFSKAGFVYENEPPSRLTLSYQLGRALWMGNTSFVTSTRSGVRPARMLIHGCASIARAMARPLQRIAKGERPQFHYCLFLILRGVGIVSGVLGMRLKHH